MTVPRAVTGRREGWWWDADAKVEAFLDQLVTWREIGFNMCAHAANYDSYESLPEWAKKTLARHARDPRPVLYSREQLERAGTHDRPWGPERPIFGTVRYMSSNNTARKLKVRNYLEKYA
jgi:hypothetical protein